MARLQSRDRARCNTARPQVCWQYQSMVRATSRAVVAWGPRVVHHCKLANKGTPLIPASISPIQWKPGTQMGRPLGGLRKAGLDAFEAFRFAGKHGTQPFGCQTLRLFQHATIPDRQDGLAGFL